jgi:hypothetical protein
MAGIEDICVVTLQVDRQRPSKAKCRAADIQDASLIHAVGTDKLAKR